MSKNTFTHDSINLNDIPDVRMLPGQDKAILQMLDKGLDISFAVLTPELRYIYISQHTYEFLSLDQGDINVGDHISDLHDVMIAKGLLTPEIMAEEKLKVETESNQLQDGASGARRLILGNGRAVEFSRITLSNGYIVSVANDISSLAEKDHLLTQALLIGNAGYWTYCFNEKKFTVNKTLSAMLTDKQKTDINKRGILESIHPEDRLTFKNAIKNVKANNDKFEFTSRVGNEAAGYTWGRTIGRLIYDKGRPKELQAFVINVEKEMEQAEELMRAKDAAIAASQAKSEFLANMSHEIRTPLNGILGMAELLSHSAADERQKEFLSVINSSASALLTIINDILDFSKIEAGALELDLMPFNLKSSLNDVTSLLSTNAQAKNLELIINYPVDMPYDFIGDEGRLRQVITNLVGNAIKFTESGHITIDVSIKLRDTLGFVDISVTDTGIGITPDKINSIFEKFTQADGSTTRVYGGTGLGLTISKRIVEIMNGNLKASSVLGKGSTFQFQIPLQRDLNAEIIKFDLTAIAGKKALIVDDIKTNRHILTEQLKHWNVTPITVKDGLEALQIIKEEQAAGKPFDIIILDYLMPGLDGQELAQIITRSSNIQNVPMIMLSSCDQSISTQELNAIGIHAYLLKPVREKRLFDTITQVISHPDNQKTRIESTDAISESSEPTLLDHITPPHDNGNINDIAARLPKPSQAKPEPQALTAAALAPPLNSGASISEIITEVAREDAPQTLPKKPYTVLVAEDFPLNRDVVNLMLSDTEYEPVFAVNGKEAVDIFSSSYARFDAVLMDISMPVMDGYQATKNIRAIEAKHNLTPKPIIALTGHALRDDRQLCLDAGMDDYLTKPVKQSDLLEVLGRHTRSERPAKTA